VISAGHEVTRVSLTFRRGEPRDEPRLRELLIDSFAPITWARRVDERFGIPNGQDWRERWQARLTNVFASEIVLVGETGGEIAACATGTVDPQTKVGYVDLIGVDRRYQGRGHGREMLRAMLAHFKDLGAVHANLDCLEDNDAGNGLYRAEGFQEIARHIRWYIKLA
jgi:ribosomal-protein-alanine N-acetyltransferase